MEPGTEVQRNLTPSQVSVVHPKEQMVPSWAQHSSWKISPGTSGRMVELESGGAHGVSSELDS